MLGITYQSEYIFRGKSIGAPLSFLHNIKDTGHQNAQLDDRTSYQVLGGC